MSAYLSQYTHNIHAEDQNVWLSITQEQRSTELLRLKQSLEHSYRIALAMSEDETLDVDERLEALNKKDDSRLSICQLLDDVDMISKLSPVPKDKDRHEYKEQYEWRERGERVLNEG